MFQKVFDSISDWSVLFIHFVYRLLVQNTYFILSNSLFLLLLFVLRFNMNNFIFFIVPIFFLLASFSAQFKEIQDSKNSKDTIALSRYFVLYKQIIKNAWPIFLFYTCAILFIVLDLQILFIADLTVMRYPLLITGCFLLSSMFFVLLISIDERTKEISLKRKLMWSLLISYRLPSVTLLNVLCVMVTIFCLQNYSLAYLCFFGGVINYYIYLNLNRRFSIALFLEQMGVSKIEKEELL